MNKLIVSSLSIYPVKSARGVSLKSMRLNSMGPECDRRWMVIDNSGAFVTQRKVPKMSQINIELIKSGIRLSADGFSSCFVTRQDKERVLTSSVWGAEVEGHDCGDDVALWLSDFLSKDCRLIYMPDNFKREVDNNFARNQELLAFADGFPLLICSQASLDDFNNKLGYKISMNRFRPNIVISGNQAYAEDHWHTIAINGIEFSLVKPCSRCIIPSINPQTGVKEMAVNDALQAHRRRGQDTFFGQNALYNKLGTIQIGDEVKIVK